MERKIYVKINDRYIKNYRVATSIIQGNNTRYITKEALSEEAQIHLQNMFEGYEKLNQYFPNLHICDIEKKGEKIYFPFIEGEQLTSRFFRAMRDNDKLAYYQCLDFQLNLLKTTEENQCEFTFTDEFINTFGYYSELEGVRAYKFCSFEITANNILMPYDSKPVLIDYEWCFDFPVPMDLIKYHAINSLYYNFIEFEAFEPFERVLQNMNLKIDVSILSELKGNFLKHILIQPGRKKPLEDVLQGYSKPIKTLDNLLITEQRIMEMEEMVSYQNKVIELRDEGIKQQLAYIKELEVKSKELHEKIAARQKELEAQQKIIALQQNEISELNKLFCLKAVRFLKRIFKK